MESGSRLTAELLERARDGDREAMDRLLGRYLARLRRWARGRIPNSVRDAVDTDDLVQDTLLRAVQRFDRIHATGGAGFQAYLRQVLVNRIREEVRRRSRRPDTVGLESSIPAGSDQPSPVEELVSRETLDRYEAGLAALSESDRAAVVAGLELGSSYAEIAEEHGKPSANAARMAVVRAVERLVAIMNRDGRTR